MSEDSLNLVLQIKVHKSSSDIAKVQIKSEQITPFGGIYSIMEQFDSKRLDNLAERVNRYISLTRRRLTIGSHTGAEVAVLYHSLAITCHRCRINIFEYFYDIINRCAAWSPNTPSEKYRDLLPDRWKQMQR